MLRTFVSLVDRIIDMNSSAVCTGHCLKCISLIPAEQALSHFHINVATLTSL